METREYIPHKVKALVWDNCGGKCWYCQQELNPFRNLTVDHVVPISRGGNSSAGNLVLACRFCNSKKNNRTDGWVKGCMVGRVGFR